MARRKRTPYYVYILQCADDSLYTGIALNIERRLAQHQAGVASRYTRSRGVKKILYTEKLPSRSAALRREAAIKRLTRTEKLTLISSLDIDKTQFFC